MFSEIPYALRQEIPTGKTRRVAMNRECEHAVEISCKVFGVFTNEARGRENDKHTAPTITPSCLLFLCQHGRLCQKIGAIVVAPWSWPVPNHSTATMFLGEGGVCGGGEQLAMC